METEARIIDLREERAAGIRRMREILDAAEADKRADLSAEEEQEYERLETGVDDLGKRITRLENQRARELELAGRTGNLDPRQAQGDGRPAEFFGAEYQRAFSRYLRLGMGELDGDERRVLRVGFVAPEGAETRDMTKGTNTAGGFTVPTDFRRRLAEHLIQAGTMRLARTTKIVTSAGEDLQVPKTTGHGAANWVAEGAAISGTDETLGQVTLKAYKAVRLVKVSQELVEDNAVDLEGFLARVLGLSIGTLENTGFVNGAGSTQPTGIVGGSTLGVTTASATAVTPDELLDFFYAVTAPYRRNGEFMFGDAAVKAIRKLKDTEGRYMWQNGLAFGEPDNLLGRPVLDDPDMPAYGTTANKFGLFGDLTAYWIRDVGRSGPPAGESSQDVGDFVVRRLEERYADNLQIGFLAFHRTDGNLIDTTGAVKHIKHA